MNIRAKQIIEHFCGEGCVEEANETCGLVEDMLKEEFDDGVKKGAEDSSKKLGNRLDFEITTKEELKRAVLNYSPIHLYALAPKSIFGEYYKYDLPKWCKENKFHCFYRPSRLGYVILSDEFYAR